MLRAHERSGSYDVLREWFDVWKHSGRPYDSTSRRIALRHHLSLDARVACCRHPSARCLARCQRQIHWRLTRHDLINLHRLHILRGRVTIESYSAMPLHQLLDYHCPTRSATDMPFLRLSQCPFALRLRPFAPRYVASSATRSYHKFLLEEETALMDGAGSERKLERKAKKGGEEHC